MKVQELIDAINQQWEERLNKIRAEIEQEYLAEGHLSDYWDAIDKCLQIVDKYKAKSEE